MQLDNTRIAIRERGYFDILDLSLRVIRAYAWPLVPILAAGVLPMIVLNAWLLTDCRQVHFELNIPLQYVVLTLLLIVVEMPLAAAPATLYLGRVLFDERPSAGAILRLLVGSLPQMLIYQVLLRPLHLGWPYMSEVILLERNPIRKATPAGRSTYSRNRTLHRGEGGDTFARLLGSLGVAAVLSVSIWVSIRAIRTMLIGRAEWDVDEPSAGMVADASSWYTVCLPLSVWIVASYFAVVRFLCYLDLRIRREGWEVELVMRAERARITREFS